MKSVVSPAAGSIRAQAALILRNDLRLLWRGFRAGRWRAFGTIGLIALGLAVGHGVAFLIFFAVPGPPPLAVESVAWGFFSFLMMSAAMNHAIGLLYEKADFDLLLSSPISPRAVLLARMTAIGTGALLSVAFFVTPLLNAMSVFLHPRYLAGWLVWVLLAALSASIGVALTLSIVRWIGLRRARVTVQVLAALLGTGIFLCTQLPRMLPRETGRALASRLAAVSRHPAVTVVARAGRGDPLPLAGLAALSLGATLITSRRLARTFISGTQDASMRVTRRRASATRQGWTDHLTYATFRKDFRLIIRDPLLLAQVLPSAFYVIPALFGFSRGNGLSTLAPLAVVLASQFSLLLTAVAAAGEEGWDLIRMSPSSELRLRVAKMAAGMALPAVLALILCVVLAAMGRPWLALVSWVTAVGVAAGCSWLQVTDIRPTARRDVLKKRGGRSVGRGIVSALLMVVAAVGLGILSRDHILAGGVIVGVAWLGVLACFTLVEPKEITGS